MQPCRPRLGVRADLRAGRAKRIRGLLEVTALHPTATGTTTPDLHAEPGHDRGRDPEIGLILIGFTGQFDLSATTPTRCGQHDVENPLRVGRHVTMSVAAMRLAGLAARPSRVIDRVTLGERRRLTFPATPRVAQQLLQLSDPHITLRHRGDQPGHLGFECADPVVHQHILHHPARRVVDATTRRANYPLSTYVWTRPAPRDGSGPLVETYPAAALKSWHIESKGYKNRSDPDEAKRIRGKVVDAIEDAVGVWLDLERVRAKCITSDHVLDALVCSLVAIAAKAGATHLPTEDQRQAALIEGWINVPSTLLAAIAPPATGMGDARPGPERA